MKKWIVLSLLATVINSSAQSYLVHHFKNTDSGVAHYISELNVESQSIKAKALLGLSPLKESHLVFDEYSNKLIVYLPPSTAKSAQLVVLNMSTLEEQLRIDVPKIIDEQKHQLNTAPLFLSPSGKNIVFLGGENDLEVHIYQLSNGKQLLARPLSGNELQVEVTQDKKYVYTQSLAGMGQYLTVIDTEIGTTTGLIDLGRLPVKTHVHHHKLFISFEKKTNRRPVFELHQVDFKTGEKRQVDVPLSEYHFVFAGPDDKGYSFIAGKQTKKKRDLYISRVGVGNVEKSRFQKRKIMPRSMELSGNSKVLMVLGEDKMATFDATTLELISRNRLPFDVMRGILNHQGNLAIIQEDSGSEIGFVDTVEGEVVKQIGAGRIFAKAGHFISFQVSGILGMVVDYFESKKQLQFNHNETRLMVINSNSNDVTFFDLDQKKKIAAKSTGTLTQLMLQFDHNPDVVLTMNRNQINLFNTQNGEELMELKSTDLVGVDQTNGMIFYQSVQGLNQLNLQKLGQPTVYSQLKAMGVYRVE